MRTLRALLAVAALSTAAPASAVPFHGCTFFEGRLASSSMACASLQAIPADCWIYHYGPWGVIMYRGTRYKGWMPEYFLEVTNRAGNSAFDTVDAPVMKAQLRAARSAWSGFGVPPDATGNSTSQQLSRDAHDFSMFFGRALPVPYGREVWNVLSAGDSAGAVAATCFNAVTELAPETWADALNSGDRTVAGFLANTKAFFTCPITGAAGPLTPVARPAVSPCALLRLPAAYQTTMAYTTAADPTKVCMGQLGGLLPRTGWTEGSHYTAAERVAWRTASLAEDMFQTGVGVIMRDKWQIIHPVTAAPPMCFFPGSAARPVPGATETFLRMPTYDTGPAPRGTENTEYVFAVWRYREKCLDYPQAVTVLGELPLFQAKAEGICAAASFIGAGL